MPKKVAPPKVTAGGGFGFEDKTAAYFLSCLLSDKPPFDPALGTISRADDLQSETPIDTFPVSDLACLDAILQDRICNKHEERLSFYHDIFGDWARQHVLLARANTLREYLESRSASPLWHRAVRLYGLHLLERNADLTHWRSAVSALASSENKGNLAQDLLVESVIFAADPLPILERMWPDLAANHGLLLCRLLGRFLRVATFPNPMILASIRSLDPDLETEAATLWRIPYWPYWLPMLRFLHKHLEDVIKLAPQVAKIADIWLRQGAEAWPLRQEAAELALARAEQILRLKQGGVIVSDERDEDAYRAALAGARELPDRVIALALEASARREPSTQATKSRSKAEHTGAERTTFPLFSVYEEDAPPPWPDGPSRCVDSAFQKICLETDALYPLIVSNPSTAREVLLALLIEEPRARALFEPRSSIHESLGIEDVDEWYPPFYIRGPFLFFLKNQPAEGLEVVLRLVNFATERWADEWRKHSNAPPSIQIRLPDGNRHCIGDAGVYFWYRDCGNAPHSIVTVLMALEKWLYDQLDEKQAITDTIDALLKRTNSLAIIGLLSAVGKKDPSLFFSQLQPLLAVAEFHLWEIEQQVRGESHQMIGWSRDSGDRLVKLAHDWHSLPHRRQEINGLSQFLFLNFPQTRPFFGEARSHWQSRLNESNRRDALSDYLEKLIARFDISNWKTQNHPEHGEIWAFEPPPMLRMKSEVNVEDAVCGGVAVLLQFHRDWLKQYPERKEWCVKQLINIIQNPPEAGTFESETDAIDWRWDSFCAQIIPLLWAEDPDSPIFRECVAVLAASYYYKTVEILFCSAAKVRSHLGESFKQLQHFLLRWAVARWQWDRTRYTREPHVNAVAWLQREIKAFVKKSIPAQIPPWDKLVIRKPPRKRNQAGHQGRRSRQSPDFDIELIQAAYTWLPSLDQATSEIERAEWINFWKEALGCTLQMFGGEIGADERIAGTPYNWDLWVFAHIAPLTMELRPTESPEDFWKPILGLGVPGHYWVKYFLREWFMNGLRPERSRDAFVREWRTMVEFAFFSPKWNFDLVSHRLYLEEMLSQLMGFDGAISDMWNVVQKPVVKRMRDMYERWANAHLKRSRCAISFIAFLKQPAAEEILSDGLIWLEKAAIPADDHFWGERNIQEELASLLDICLRSHQSKLNQQQPFSNAFKNLLKKLADFQNPLALEIQQRIVSIYG
jgi:hypothetical protein